MGLPPNFGYIWEQLIAGSGHPGWGAALAATLASLREQGITGIVTLTEEPLETALLREFEFDSLFLPVEDFTAPTPDQVEQAIKFLDDHARAGQGALVHCRAGMGRTGTILACFLVSRGMGPAEAIAHVRRQRPGSVEVYPQEYVIYQYARRLQGDSPQDEQE